MNNTEELVSKIKSDPNRKPFEKEFSLHFNKDTKKATIQTFIASTMRHLLKNPQFELTGTHVSLPSTDFVTRKKPSEIQSEHQILSIRGKLPINCLTVKATARESDGYADIVSSSTGG